MNTLMRITLAAALSLSAGAPYARPAAEAPAEFVRRAATLAAGDQFTLASPRHGMPGWRRLLRAPSSEADGAGGLRWYEPGWSADELRIGMRGLAKELQHRRNSAEKCSAYLQ